MLKCDRGGLHKPRGLRSQSILVKRAHARPQVSERLLAPESVVGATFDDAKKAQSAQPLDGPEAAPPTQVGLGTHASGI